MTVIFISTAVVTVSVIVPLRGTHGPPTPVVMTVRVTATWPVAHLHNHIWVSVYASGPVSQTGLAKNAAYGDL